MSRCQAAAFLSWILCLPVLADPAQEAPPLAPFTQQDLERLVAELVTVVPENPLYTYPIEVRLVPSPEVNAWTFPQPREGKLVPQLELMSGLVDLTRGDQRLLRAVLAHELAHLASGHSLERSPYQDLGVAHTRQQEFEADAVGARYLVALGHPAEDMVDMLRVLDLDLRDHAVPWLAAVTGDHASPITRAARLARDEPLFEAVMRYEIGVACMECRRYAEAISWFDQAGPGDGTWRLYEADLDAASAALQEYYDRLPGAVQEEWLRPEFGPHLTDVQLLRGRAIEIGPEDLQRYAAALARIEQAPAWFSAPMREFLLGTAHVLDPRGDEDLLRQGMGELQGILDGTSLGFWDLQALGLHVANNMALGLHRLGQGERAASVLMAAQQRHSTVFVPSVAENLARLPLEGMTGDQALLAANVLYTFLTWTPLEAPGGRHAERALAGLQSKYSFQVTTAPRRAPVALCGVSSMILGGREVGLFQPFGMVSEIVGSIPAAGYPNPRLPDLRFLVWGDAELIALIEGEQLIKLTSYRPGSTIELRPTRESGLRAGYSVRIGMTKAELDELLRPTSGQPGLLPQQVLLLDRRSFQPIDASPDADGAAGPAGEDLPRDELWTYFPQLSFGVLIENGIVTGLSVTPVTR